MRSTLKNFMRVAGVLAGLGAATWALRGRLLPTTVNHDEPPPKFRSGGGTSDLTEIKGIGPVYQERLAANGIHSFADLSIRSAEDIADIASASEAVAEGWVKSAQALT